MTHGTKRNITLIVTFCLLLAVIGLALTSMNKIILGNSTLKIDAILKLAPTYFLLALTTMKSAYDIINNIFSVPKFKLELNQQRDTYNLAGRLTVTNETKKEIEILNIQNSFYELLPLEDCIPPQEIKHIEVKFILHSEDAIKNKIKSKKSLLYIVAYKTNDSNQIKRVSIKESNIFYTNRSKNV